MRALVLRQPMLVISTAELQMCETKQKIKPTKLWVQTKQAAWSTNKQLGKSAENSAANSEPESNHNNQEHLMSSDQGANAVGVLCMVRCYQVKECR